MNILKNGCRYSDFNIFPSNWNTTRASLKKIWRIEYRFYDPAFKVQYPEGYPKVVKAGLNRIKDLAGRQQLMKELIFLEKDLLDEQGYNPIVNQKKKPTYSSNDEALLDPSTPFITALKRGLESKAMDGETRKDIANKIPHIQVAAAVLTIDGKPLADMPIKDVRRKHIRLLFNQIGKNKGDKWTANNFNRYRTDLRIIFEELNELEAMEVNPMDGLKKRKQTIIPRETLSIKERVAIDTYLKGKYYQFWRFLHIFYHSGCRESEMVRIERSHVDLSKGRFKVLIKKGESNRWAWKAINNQVTNIWEEVIREADSLPAGGEGERLYLFSEDLKPMWRHREIRSDQITKRWYRLVKKKEEELGFKVTADFYSLKHLSTTESIDVEMEKALLEAQRKVAQRNGHTTTAMVRNIYDVKNEQRELDIKRKAKNKFA